MTNQEIFDKVYRHLMTQKRRALGAENRCLYLAPDGSKCAVGCLIPDELYTPEIETASARDAAEKVKDNRSSERTLSEIFYQIGIRPENAELLGALQVLHDQGCPEGWASRLKNIAARFRLTVPS